MWGSNASIYSTTGGKLISTTGTLKDTVGVKNPYLYRGYRYDKETGLYYLQSRYYSPDWGRFLNADNIGGVQGQLLSHNMFVYCMNNHVNYTDPTGHYGIKKGFASITFTLSHKETMSLIRKIALVGAVYGLAAFFCVLIPEPVLSKIASIACGMVTVGMALLITWIWSYDNGSGVVITLSRRGLSYSSR